MRRRHLLRGAAALVGLGAATAAAGYAGVRPGLGADPSGADLERIARSPNFREGAFRNLVDVPDMTSERSGWRTMAEFLLDDTPGLKPTAPVPSRRMRLRDLRAGEMVWLGHSGFVLRENGLTILIDPSLHEASPLPFTFRPFPGSNPYAPADLPDADILLITHDHYDHLDWRTVRALPGRVKRVVCPLGVGSHFAAWGWPREIITELDWFESTKAGARTTITAVPSQHFSGRTMRRNTTLWAGFVIEFPGRTLYLSGDGGMGPHFAEIRRIWPKIDLAVLEDGQYNRDWSTIHLMPADWRRAAAELAPAALLPCHNSKYDLSRHVWTDPLERAAASSEALGIALATPMIGEAFPWARAETASRRWWPAVP